LAAVSLGLFLVQLAQLVTTVALPSIQLDLGGSIETLQWVINAYTLSFAVSLLVGSALGDRFGRRRMFLAGTGLFVAASVAAALAPSVELLIGALAVAGVGAAIVTPLSLTLLAEAYPVDQRGPAIGVWAGVSGLAVALGPLVGGAVVQTLSWQWIYWINVPIGLVALPLAAWALDESRGPAERIDVTGLLLIGPALLGVVLAVVRANSLGWTHPVVVWAMTGGVVLLVAFARWQGRAEHPMIPPGLFRSRTFSLINIISMIMFFGIFGSIFLLTQLLQVVLRLDPLHAGLSMLLWTGATLLVAPLAGVAAARIGPRPLVVSGLGVQAVSLATIAAVTAPGMSLLPLALPFVLAGAGMALVIPTASATVINAVPLEQAGRASGAASAIRELGAVFGVALSATVFTSARGGYDSAEAFVTGSVPALWMGAGVMAVGTVLACGLPATPRTP
jgi:EmrB/QacA subfamily drug resistance transporter